MANVGESREIKKSARETAESPGREFKLTKPSHMLHVVVLPTRLESTKTATTVTPQVMNSVKVVKIPEDMAKNSYKVITYILPRFQTLINTLI